MVEFIEINDTETREFEEAISIYIESISAAERQRKDVIKNRVASKKERMIIGRQDAKIVMVSLLWPLQGTEYILIDYMAVKKSYRSQGIGTSFLRNIFQLSGVNDKGFILEVEDPRYGDKEIRHRRVKFYKRNGAKELSNVKYMVPPLEGDTPTKMIIMVLFSQHKDKMSGKLVKKLLLQIYEELYGRSQNDPLLNSFIHTIPSEVELV